MPYGKDGTFYNDWKEMRRADEAWYQRDKNNKLLQEQNKMKKKEIEIMEKEQKEKNRLLQEQNNLMKKQNEEQKRQNEELEKQSKELERHNKEIEKKNSLNTVDEEIRNSNNNNQVKIQQFNMSQDNVQNYVDRGMMYLEDNNTEKAIEFFEMALDINPQLATAHLGKFLADYNVYSLNDLQDYTISDLENSKDFMRALEFSNGEDKIVLQEFFENNKAKVEHQENEELKSKQKIQELCKNFEQNHKNMQEENYRIVQELFEGTKEEIQQLKNNKLNLEKEILELETKLDSLGLFKSNEKKNIRNEIENKNKNISEMLKTTQNLKENCKKEIMNVYKQEQEDIEGWKELLKETDDIFLKEQMNLVLKNLGVDIEDELDPILNDYKNIEKILSNGEISTSLIQRKFQVGYARARKNSRPTGRKRYDFCL